MPCFEFEPTHKAIHAQELLQFGLLSLGMAQLRLPNLLLTGPLGRKDDAVEWFLSLLEYAAARCAVPKDGETVGRSADECMLVRHVPSPRDENDTVWRVEMT